MECEELEDMDKRGRSDLVYAEVKKITRTDTKSTSSTTGIKDLNGNLLTEPVEVRERWKSYVEDLYSAQDKPVLHELGIEKEEEIEQDIKGPEILESEITAAIKEMRTRKAVGPDNIPAEFLKILGKDAQRQLIEIFKNIYLEGVWPEDFTRVIMLPLQKKPNATECSDHRTISLISHASKILLRILNNRIETKARGFMGDTQFSFRRGCGTRDAVGVVRMLCERSLELDNEVFSCFVDFEKAFDRVNWVKMMDILKIIGVDWRDRRLISNLYMNQIVTVKIWEEFSEPGVIGRGVRQGCCLSPLLFSLYSEMIDDDIG